MVIIIITKRLRTQTEEVRKIAFENNMYYFSFNKNSLKFRFRKKIF